MMIAGPLITEPRLQELDDIVQVIKDYCNTIFHSLHNDMTLEVCMFTANRDDQKLTFGFFQVNFTHKASWWLASPENIYFKTLEQAIEKIWGQPPLKIREGGVRNSVSFCAT